MSLTVNQNIGNTYVCENFHSTTQESMNLFPKEVILEIFTHVNFATLATIGSVSKEWQQLSNEPIVWKKAIYRQSAFGNDKWAKLFGDDVVKEEDKSEELSSLPSDEFIADCKKFKKLFPKKNATDCLMLVRLPKTLNGGLTLKTLGHLARQFFSYNPSGYRDVSPTIIEKIGDNSIDKSCWVLMTKDVLPESKNKTYGQQQKMISNLKKKSLIGYKVPTALESATCILSHYFDTNVRLFSNQPQTFTRCKEKIEGYEIAVGAFDPDGFIIENRSCDGGTIGIAALRKF